MQQALQILSKIKIATPCPSSWGGMAGDERMRLCGLCQKNVYNIATMTAEEALALIREKEGNLCVRLYRRQDGTVLTADCPEGLRLLRRGLRRVAITAAAILAVLTWCVTFKSMPWSQRRITSVAIVPGLARISDRVETWRRSFDPPEFMDGVLVP